MRTLTRLIALGLVSLALTACVEERDETPRDPDPSCAGVECEPEPELNPSMKGSYISAHLGTYWDCPEDGYTPGAGLEPPREDSGERAADDSAGACAPGATCEEPLNCEDGSFTLRLTNSGQVPAVGVIVTRLELFNSTGSVGTLPIGEFVDRQTHQPFDGVVDPGETVSLRVEFMGPYQPHTFLGGEHVGDLEVTIASDNHEDVKIRGEDIAALPGIAT